MLYGSAPTVATGHGRGARPPGMRGAATVAVGRGRALAVGVAHAAAIGVRVGRGAIAVRGRAAPAVRMRPSGSRPRRERPYQKPGAADSDLLHDRRLLTWAAGRRQARAALAP